MENNLFFGIIFISVVAVFVFLHFKTVRKFKRILRLRENNDNWFNNPEFHFFKEHSQAQLHKTEKRVLQTEIKYLKEQVELLKRKR